MPFPTPAPPDTPDLELTPAASDLDLGSVLIDKAALPYVTEWFNDLKRAGDTPLKFLLRRIYAEALTHRQRKIVDANAAAHTSQGDEYHLFGQDEHTRIASLIEGLLP
jgi:hypothetical protein